MEEGGSGRSRPASTGALVQSLLLIVGGVVGALVSTAFEDQSVGWLVWPAVVMILVVLAVAGGWLSPNRIGLGWSRLIAMVAGVFAIAVAAWSVSTPTGPLVQALSIALIWVTATAASWSAFSSTSGWPQVALSTALVSGVVAIALATIETIGTSPDLDGWPVYTGVVAVILCASGLVLSAALLVGRTALVGIAAIIAGVAVTLAGGAAIVQNWGSQNFLVLLATAGTVTVGVACIAAGLARLTSRPLLYGIAVILIGVGVIAHGVHSLLLYAPLLGPAILLLGLGFLLYGVALLANDVVLSGISLIITGCGPAWAGVLVLYHGSDAVDVMWGMSLVLMGGALVASGIALSVSRRFRVSVWWARVHAALSRGRETGVGA